MFESKNLYVLNKKDKDAIVYTDIDGKLIRLTREDFESEEAFRGFKEWSDNDYHTTEKARHQHSDNVLSLDGLSEEAVSVGSVEDAYIEESRKSERVAMCRLLRSKIDVVLTPAQRRRLWLHCVDGLSTREIAFAENVSHQSVIESINAAKKKILKIF